MAISIWYGLINRTGIIIFNFTGLLNYFISKKKSKLLLTIGILISVIPLIYLKYINITNIIVLFGISYYALQMISFIVDVYKKKIEIENNFIEYLLYMYYIPCMFIGPINRYDDLAYQLKNNIRIKSENLYYGLYRIIIGLFKKTMIANGIAVLIKAITSNTSSYYGFYVLFAVMVYSIQLYADFSGATDMVIGISKIFNINIKENFKEPYLSQSISELWRRWHMTLGSWLRDYVYIPLGGNRCGKLRKSFNLIATFTMSGLWHGLNYIVWGLIHGIFCALNIKTKNKYFNIVLNYILVSLLSIVFVLLNILVTPKYITEYKEGNMISEYYSEIKNHEVIFIGDCEVYANFSPLVMYEESGITSYVRGSSQQLIWQSYYILKETIKYEIPKVVVLNVNSMRYSKPVNEAYNRMTIDKMKWSKEKIDIINSSMTEEENFISYVFPILRYHSRISKLTKEDFNYFITSSKNTFNGFLINKKVKPYTSLPTRKILDTYNFEDIDYAYLNKIYELCKDNNIELLLIKAPSLYPYWYEEYNDQIEKFALDKKIEFINLLEYKDIIGIDYETDTYDGGLHLNLDGATKLSTFFADYLINTYSLTDYRKNKDVNKIYQEKLKDYKI